jgi:hypothetical protein
MEASTDRSITLRTDTWSSPEEELDDFCFLVLEARKQMDDI